MIWMAVLSEFLSSDRLLEEECQLEMLERSLLPFQNHVELRVVALSRLNRREKVTIHVDISLEELP